MVPSSLDAWKFDLAAVDARADHKLIVAAEDLARAGELRRTAEGVGLGPGAIDRAGRQAAENAGGDHVAVHGKQRIVVLFETQEGGIGAGHDLTRVSVHVHLAKAAVVDVALDVEPVTDVVAQRCVHQVELVLVGLRRRIDRTPALVEQLDRRRGGRAERIRGGRVVDVELGTLAAGADVGEQPPQPRGRAVAPAVVVERVGRDVAGDVADLLARLKRDRAATERAAAHLRLGALPDEAVLHLDRQRAAERVEPVDRIVRDEVDPLNRIFRDEVPVHRVAENLVDAHAVLIDRQPCGVPSVGEATKPRYCTSG